MTEHSRLGGLINKCLFLGVLEVGKSKTKMQFPCLVRTHFLVHSQQSLCCALTWQRGEVGELFFEGTNLIREDSALMTQSRPKGPTSNGDFFFFSHI